MIPSGRYIACDTETTGLHVWLGAKPFYFSFCNEIGETAKFRWRVDPLTRQPIPEKKSLEEMKAFFWDMKRIKVFHNSKFDIRMLESVGIKVRGLVEDTYFAAHTLRTNELTHALKPLAKKYLGFPDEDEKALDAEVARQRRIAKKKGWNIAIEGRDGPKPVKADMWLAEDKFLDAYGVGDAERTILLWKVLKEELEADPVCMQFYRRELKLQSITMRMEARGVSLRRKVAERELKEHREKAENCLTLLRKEVGPEFNPASPSQVSDFVYGKLKMPVQHYTDTGRPSTNINALLEMDHPTVRVLQQYNSASDAVNNFFQKYLDLSVPENGIHILHPEFNQVGPATGRFSCRNPNLQNAPNAITSRSPYPIQARSPFGPRPGYTWWHYDYSAEEVWIFADGAKEEKLLKALYAGLDPHGEAADFVWGKGTVAREAAQGLKTARGKAKMLLFGILYGMGIKSCARFLKVSNQEASGILDRYHTHYTRIKPFMEEMNRRVELDGYVKTAWGRKIFVDRGFGYKATNYYVQGTGADVMKEAMFNVQSYLNREHDVDAHLVLTIHDELVLELNDRDFDPGFLQRIREIMEDHQGMLGIKKLPVEIARTKDSWDKKEEKFDIWGLKHALKNEHASPQTGDHPKNLSLHRHPTEVPKRPRIVIRRNRPTLHLD